VGVAGGFFLGSICRCCRSGRCSPTRCACDQREAEKSRESELE
jgi:hypothetical protein